MTSYQSACDSPPRLPFVLPGRHCARRVEMPGSPAAMVWMPRPAREYGAPPRSSPMDPTVSRELRQVRTVLIAAGIVSAVVSLGAFRQAQQTHFAEIDVERINVVEQNGKLRLTISNAARLPDPIIGGKSYPLRGG